MLWLVPQLGPFHKAHPEIDISIRTLDQELGKRASTGADLEIAIGEPSEGNPPSDKLFSATIVPICSSALLLDSSTLANPHDILSFELIHVLGYDDDWHRWFRRYVPGHGTVPRGLSVDGSLIAIEAAQRGDGVMLGRRPFIDPYLASGELIDVFGGTYALHADYFVRKLRPGKTGRATDQVARWLVELGEKSRNEKSLF